MTEEFEANAEGVDFALVAYREDSVWQLQELDQSRRETQGNISAQLEALATSHLALSAETRHAYGTPPSKSAVGA